MLQNRIISTLQFFDLQDIPLTLFELHKFLVNDPAEIKKNINFEFEHIGEASKEYEQVTLDAVFFVLENQLKDQIQTKNGYYCLPGRVNIIDLRINNYFYGFKREKIIKKYSGFLKNIPFVRGVALAGSQALGQPKDSSDIDLLIITDSKFLWLARTLVTIFFQVIGKRRYGKNIANRFCLNHYLAGPKAINNLKNFYTASEYLKLRPLAFPEVVREFQKANPWIFSFFPNSQQFNLEKSVQPKGQKVLEKLFIGSFGKWLELNLKAWQLRRIRQEKFIVVTGDELSFHPESKQKDVLLRFAKFQQ